MAKKGGSDDWWILLLLALAGGVALYYIQTGRGEENDAALIPNNLERQIDRVVAELNKQFGKRWADWGMDALMSHLQKVLPPQVVALVGAVSAVELASRRTSMTSSAKRQAAVQRALVG
ncbi:MAG TPA: hypothetical protein VF528_04815 [Pyrinomonadaceae bacterium]|jgi:trehalose-6-phosphate synthase